MFHCCHYCLFNAIWIRIMFKFCYDYDAKFNETFNFLFSRSRVSFWNSTSPYLPIASQFFQQRVDFRQVTVCKIGPSMACVVNSGSPLPSALVTASSLREFWLKKWNFSFLCFISDNRRDLSYHNWFFSRPNIPNISIAHFPESLQHTKIL